jgi:membrane protease YdiL (CAAX protease family)
MIVIQSMLLGLLVSFVGTLVWSLFTMWNLHTMPLVPWTLVPGALFLYGYWKYLGGSWWPADTSDARRRRLRANRVSGEAWGMSMLAGLLGFGFLLALLNLMAKLMTMPAEEMGISTPPAMPGATAFALITMSSVVAGVVEEAAFRGYIQVPIEQAHGPVAAVLASGLAFGFGHISHHPAAVVAMLPYYIAVSAVYGGLAYLTNSILPSLVLHAGGDVWSLTRLWTTGRPEWQLSPSPPPLVWQTGLDQSFMLSVFAFMAATFITLWAYRELARTVGREGRGDA